MKHRREREKKMEETFLPDLDPQYGPLQKQPS